jgi:hypothetical protein
LDLEKTVITEQPDFSSGHIGWAIMLQFHHLVPKVMTNMLKAVEKRVTMPAYMKEQMPDLIPAAMENLLPNMLPLIIPLLTPKMIQYIKDN